MLLIACNNVPREVSKSTLYSEVTRHYQVEDVSLMKLEAAIFMFDHMAYHYTLTNERAKNTLDSCIESFLISEQAQKRNIHKAAPKYINSCYMNKEGETELLMDINQLSSSFIIKHIDASFSAWKKIAQVGEIDFNKYCHFVLPYRVNHEAVEQDFCFGNEYNYFIDSLLEGYDFESTVQKIIGVEDIYLKRDGYNFPFNFTIKQIHNLRSVKSCDDAALYFVMLFRSLGIPATVDRCKRSYRNTGHSLLALYWKSKWYSFEVPDGNKTIIDTEHAVQNFPKVYRSAYSINFDGQDITKQFTPTIDIPLKESRKHKPAIAIFDVNMRFEHLSSNVRREGEYQVFENMGVDCIYALGASTDKDFLVDSIVLVDSLGLIHRLQANYEQRQTLVLKRKYFMDKRHNVRKKHWVNDMNKISLIGCNSIDFGKGDTLFRISGHSVPYSYRYKLNCEKPYKYIYLNKGDEKKIYLSEFYLYDENGEVIKIDTLKNLHLPDFYEKVELGKTPTEPLLLTNAALSSYQKMFDGNGLTYSAFGLKGKLLAFFPEGIKPQSFSIQPRNDENHIVVGDLYELMMWEDGWKSLGRKKAFSNEVIFKNVPSGALYWLRNLTRGKEEYPFVIDKNGDQYWTGQANN